MPRHHDLFEDQNARPTRHCVIYPVVITCRKLRRFCIVIASILIPILLASGCASPGYKRTCSWCDDASQAQLSVDVEECNVIAKNQVPDSSVSRKTGRIVTSQSPTYCSTNKKGDQVSCSGGNIYTYPETTTVDVTDYKKREQVFTECFDARAKNYRSKSVDQRK